MSECAQRNIRVFIKIKFILIANREKIAQWAAGVPNSVHSSSYNKEKARGSVMEQNNRKICSMCGKRFDMWDEQEDFCFVRHIGYGSKYDMKGLYLNLCCDCFDKIADWFLPLCVQNPLRDEEDCWHAFSPVVSDALFFHKQLLGQMKDRAKQLCAQLEGISADDSDFRLQLLKAADVLLRFSDYVQYEIKSLPARGEEDEKK